MFSGIGGFELGIEQVVDGAECVGFSEIDKYAIQVYLNHYPKHFNYGDATKIDETRLPDFDLLCGGFPCQSFSVAGKRKGFEDTRGTLFFDIARIAAHKRPRYLLLENVKGLLTHDSGKTFQTILKVLADIGYRVEWQLLNSKDFGVPQNRERVFIVGYLGEESSGQVFPITTNVQSDIVLPTLTARYYGGQANGGYICEQPSEAGSNQSQTIVALREVRSDEAKRIRRTFRKYGGGDFSPRRGKRLEPRTDNLIGTVTSSRNLDNLLLDTTQVAIPVLTPNRLMKRQNGRRFKTDGEPSFTLNTQDRHGVFDGYRIRRLTPIEAERLQGFPDNWTAFVSDTQRYKCLGNAVTVNVVSAVINKLFSE